MKCLRCGSEVLSETGNAEIIMKYPKCGWAAVTTYMSEIEEDICDGRGYGGSQVSY